jgi:hypothetical protein
MNWDHVADSLQRTGRKWVTQADLAQAAGRAQHRGMYETVGLLCLAFAGALHAGLGKPTLPGDKK